MALIDERALRDLIADVVRQVLREGHVSSSSDGDSYLDVTTAADVAGVSAQTIRLWIKTGRLGQYRAGREWRVLRSELDAALAGRTGVEDPRQAALRIVTGGRRR